MTTDEIPTTAAGFIELAAKREAEVAAKLHAARQRIVEASKALADRWPPGMGTTREEMRYRLGMARLVGCLQGLACSGDLSEEGVRCVVEALEGVK